MSASLQIGPLALPYTLLLVVGAVALGSVVAQRIGRRTGVDAEPHAFRVLLVAVVVARIAFVWQYRSVYLDAPLGMLDIRDGGWNAPAGLLAAWVAGLLWVWRRRALRAPLLAALASASAVFVLGSTALALSPQNEAPLPAIILARLEGGTTSLQSFEGKPTVVNLWATWCPPCQREMPMLQRAQAEHPDVHFVFLNQGESAEAVQRFLAGHRFDLRNVLLDAKGQAGARFGQRALPTTLFFDATGRLVDQRIGELSQATLAQRLDALRPSSSSTTSP